VFFVPDLAKKNWSVVMLEKKDCGDWKCCWGGGIQLVWWNSIL
jgi:hypothetical protein